MPKFKAGDHIRILPYHGGYWVGATGVIVDVGTNSASWELDHDIPAVRIRRGNVVHTGMCYMELYKRVYVKNKLGGTSPGRRRQHMPKTKVVRARVLRGKKAAVIGAGEQEFLKALAGLPYKKAK